MFGFKNNIVLFFVIIFSFKTLLPDVVQEAAEKKELVSFEVVENDTVAQDPAKDVQKDKDIVVINFNLTKKDCDVIIKFLKNLDYEEKDIYADLKSFLLSILKDGFFIYSSVLTGLGIVHLLSNKDSEIFKSKIFLGLCSGMSMISAYIMMKLVDKKMFGQKDEKQVIKDLLNKVREINEGFDFPSS